MQIDIFDAIGADFFGGGITARGISEQLSLADEGETVEVRINSPGGDVFEGHAIYNMLAAHDGPVEVVVQGIAASMASIIALAGDKVSMADNAMFMIHNPWALSAGDADKMRKTADKLDKIRTTLSKVYTRVSGLETDEVHAMMDAETWMTADEAKQNGFITDITSPDPNPTQVAPEAEARIYATLHKFQQAPLAVFSQYKSTLGKELIAAHGVRRQEPKKANMNKAQILALFDLTEDATDEEIRAKAMPPSLKDMVPRADLDSAREKLVAAEAKLLNVAKAEQKRFEDEASACVDQACADGKISPASKAYHIKNATRDRESLEEFKAFIAGAAPVVSNVQMETKQTLAVVEDNAVALSASEKEICASMGISEEQFLKQKQEDSGKGMSALYGSTVG